MLGGLIPCYPPLATTVFRWLPPSGRRSWGWLVFATWLFGHAALGADALPGSTPSSVGIADDPVVLRVSRYVGDKRELDSNPLSISARRGDDLYVHVKDLDKWINEVKDKVPGGKIEVLDLVLVLNGLPLHGLHPNHFFTGEEDLSIAQPSSTTPEVLKRPVHYLRFTLERTSASRASWERLLQRPEFAPRSMEVSVGFDNGETMSTYVAVDGRQTFYLITLPPLRFWSGVVVILGSLAFFLALARRTDILKDTSAPARPDGKPPYSLARSQMAFWFFLVVAAFFFLWVLTGAMDTLNPSVLALIGISAGTALGSAFIDASGDRGTNAVDGSHLAPVDLSQSRTEILRDFATALGDAQERLTQLEADRAAIPKDAKAKLANNADTIAKARANLKTLGQQADYFRWPAWKGLLYDLLAEKGFVSFHRFQILVWTVVLGVMFTAGVYSETAMPEFDATLLGLLGISGGTYVGFKLPAAMKSPG